MRHLRLSVALIAGYYCPSASPRRIAPARSPLPARTARPSRVPNVPAPAGFTAACGHRGAAELMTIPMNVPAQLVTSAPTTSRRHSVSGQ
jgi:hypothetical protein